MRTPEEIRAALIGQVDRRVRWRASLQRLAAEDLLAAPTVSAEPGR